MKRILIILVFCLTPLTLFSQKVTVKIVKTMDVSVSGWQILDERSYPLYTESDFFALDTITLALEANKRYYFKVFVSSINNPDTSLYSLWINDVYILLVSSDILPGDHRFPFFTGTFNDKQTKITGGTDTDISEFPWQIYLEAGNYTCGGSIISGRWVITAAHCAKDEFNVTIPATQMVVTVGANNPRIISQGKDYQVSEVIVHEFFDPSTLNNDIALLRLSDSINYPNARPIKLISGNDANEGFTDPGVLSWVTGYGLTRIRPATYPSTLQKVQLPIVSNAQASAVWKTIPSTDVMAGYENGNMDACSGDSGGPLIVPVSNGYKLAGLISWGSNNCNTYGAYTRVSLFESWITQKTGIEITFNAPVPVGDSIICPGTTSSQYHVAQVNGVTSYKWVLLPSNAGTLTPNSESVNITWNQAFKGKASINLQVMRNTDTSEISALNVTLAKQTRIIVQPSDTVVCAAQPISLIMMTEGNHLIYNWNKNDILIQSGPSDKIIIQNAASNNTGVYFCDISGSCGSALSGTFSLTVLPVTKITSNSPDTNVTFGNNLKLEVSSEGHDLAYQWEKDGTVLSAGNRAEFIRQNVNANDIGLYRVKVTGTCGIDTSGKIYVYVKSRNFSGEPEVFVWPTLANDEFRVALSNDQNYNILLYNMIGRLMRETTNCQYETLVNISKLPAGIYILKVYNNNFRKSIKLFKK